MTRASIRGDGALVSKAADTAHRVYHTVRGRGIAERLTHESGDPPNDEKDDCQSDGVASGAGMILLMLWPSGQRTPRNERGTVLRSLQQVKVCSIEPLLRRHRPSVARSAAPTAVYRAVTA